MTRILTDACVRQKQSMRRGSALQSGKDPHVFGAQQERMRAHHGNGDRSRPTEGESEFKMVNKRVEGQLQARRKTVELGHVDCI